MEGDVAGARKTAVGRARSTTQGATIKTYNFTNCWVRSVEVNALKAGATEQATEKFTVCFDESTVELMQRSRATGSLATRSTAADRPAGAVGPSDATLRTEFDFELPRGYVDARRRRAPARHHAAGDRPRRAAAALRRAGAGERRRSRPSCCSAG